MDFDILSIMCDGIIHMLRIFGLSLLILCFVYPLGLMIEPYNFYSLNTLYSCIWFCLFGMIFFYIFSEIIDFIGYNFEYRDIKNKNKILIIRAVTLIIVIILAYSIDYYLFNGLIISRNLSVLGM